MILDISGHLYRELFLEKSVSYNPKLYFKFYSIIWPNEDSFKEFLTETDPSIQLSAAKRIFTSMQAEEELFLPSFVFQDLIWLQQEKRVKKSNGYIPQDHIIHSIYLYILGIYVFFNLQIFQRKILNTVNNVCQSEDQKVTCFIRKWKLFSIYHDIGYSLESLVSQTGTFSEKKIIEHHLTFRKQILLECVCRSVSRFIVATALLRRAHISFKAEDYSINDNRWIDKAGNNIASPDVARMLYPCMDYQLIQDIQSTEGFRHILPLLLKTRRLAVVLDTSNCPIAFFIWDKSQKVQALYHSDIALSKSEINSITQTYPLVLENKTIKYYVCIQDFQDSFLDYNSKYAAFQEEAKTYDMSLPESIRIQISMIYNDKCITQLYYDVYDWLWKNFQNFDSRLPSDPARNYEMDMNAYFSDALYNAVEKQVRGFISSQREITSENLQHVMQLLNKKISDICITDVINDASFAYDNHFGIYSGISAFSWRLYENLLVSLGDGLVNSSYIKIINRNRLQYSAFSFEPNNDVVAKLFERISSLSSDLGVGVSDLADYHSDFSICDHGVLSAAMVFDAFSFFDSLRQKSQDPPINFAWDNDEGINWVSRNDSVSIYADLIFAILLHNVYTENSKPQYGLPYKQNIDKNAFCYFCALMDKLQSWSRPKQIDFSIIDLPKDHYLGHNYDIRVFQGKLRIICNSSRVGKMRDIISSAEDYLPGISKLVCVTEEEI